MKIAFILKDSDIAEPLGIMYLSSLLKTNHHQVELFVATKKEWFSKLKTYSPRIVAYSVISGSQTDYLKINNRVKKEIETFSLFGGPHTTFFPETINENNVDAVCIGEGGYPMLELVTNLENGSDISKIKNLWVKDNGVVIKNSVRPLVENLDHLPFPDRELIYNEDKYLRENKLKRFISNRGCPFKCTYCFNRAYKIIYKGDKIFHWRSVDNVINEIVDVKNNYPMEIVRFVDDIFILQPISWLEEFAKKYKQKVNLPFVCNIQVKLVTEQKIKLLKEAGCMSVYMAIESGNDRIRKELLERNMTKDEMIEAFNLVHKYGIAIGAENILGLPESSFEKDIETLELNIKCNVDNAIATVFQPYPKTKLGRYAVEKGYFDGNFDALDKSYFKGSVLNCFTQKEKRKIENLHKFFGLAVNHPSLIPLIKILILLPSNKFYQLFYRLWDSYRKRKKIFNIKYSLNDYFSAIIRVLRY
jgi:anaerobic magnesium-protoporphyrin IX monomethyl ester cyclase